MAPPHLLAHLRRAASLITVSAGPPARSSRPIEQARPAYSPAVSIAQARADTTGSLDRACLLTLLHVVYPVRPYSLTHDLLYLPTCSLTCLPFFNFRTY